MSRMVIDLPKKVKVRIRKLRRQTRDKGLAMRCQIILHAGKGWSRGRIAEGLGCSCSWASRVIRRFRREGEAGLLDRREDNGSVKVDEAYLSELYEVVSAQPTDYGYSRPTWTRELLVAVMHRLTGVRIHVTTMSRALKAIGARRGRPRPRVGCPWSKRAKERRLAVLRRLVASLPKNEVAVYADEVDVHLNPKIGLDWMNRGHQKEVVTPGCNEKRYLAGALDAGTGRLTCVESSRKNSVLFIRLLDALAEAYPSAKVIHVILDNYRIHHSKITGQVLIQYGGRIVLHFLPPYCPDANKIERVWQDLHAEVTRNHQCPTMAALMKNVRRFIRRRNRGHPHTVYKRAA